MHNIIVKLGKRSYTIKIGHGILVKTGIYFSRLGLGRDAVIITNPKIKRLYGGALKNSLIKNGINVRFETVPDSESSKANKVCSNLINRIAKFDNKGRRPFIIAFGGGVVGDLAGFVAAVYRRGVPLVQIPSTLVAQVDSSIGGKVAIDLSIAKNLVGTFYQPRIVICDTSLLKSLPEREIKCGLSEIIKYSIISSREFFDFLRKNIKSLKKLNRKNLNRVIRKCCSIKSKIVSMDEKDTKGVRAVLNYGHTIGHAIEAATKYSGIYNHGEAIAIGMVAAAIISNKLGMLSSKNLAEITGLINKAGLPTTIKGLNASKILNIYRHDKKFTEGVNKFVLPARIGKVKLVKNIPEKLIENAIEEISIQ